VLALVEAHKAVWVRLLETEDRTDDYETLEEVGRAADTAFDAIMKTRRRRSPVRGPSSNTWSSGNKGAQQRLRLPVDTAALALLVGARQEV